MKNQQANKVKNNNGLTTSSSQMFHGYKILKDQRYLMTKYDQEQSECLDECAMEKLVDLVESFINQVTAIRNNDKLPN